MLELTLLVYSSMVLSTSVLQALSMRVKCHGQLHMPKLQGTVKGNKLVLCGYPSADMVMEVENDEWTLRHGNNVLMKVCADGDDVLSTDVAETALQVVKESVFHKPAHFENDVFIKGAVRVEGKQTRIHNVRSVADTKGFLPLYVHPLTGEIVAKTCDSEDRHESQERQSEHHAAAR